MPNSYNFNNKHAVKYFVNNPIVSNPNAETIRAFQLFTSGWPRII